jgi:NifU-like protein involved in Fe-S cluster formation
MLSHIIKQHMVSPRNMGVISTPDGVGEVVSPVCGDQFVMYLQITGGRIKKASFTTHGCWAAIAMGSLITELLEGLTPQEALFVDGEKLARENAGLSEDKWPCAHLVSMALRQAVLDWQGRSQFRPE